MGPSNYAAKNILAWGAENIDPQTIEQASRTAKLPFVEGHVALMPDAHVGIGSTVGSVIPTQNAIIPSAIGVDIGCGMCAMQLDIKAGQLGDLSGLMPDIEEAIPGGKGKSSRTDLYDSIDIEKEIGWWGGTEATSKLKSKAIDQCGTLGSGNHFFEICLDENDYVWLVLHSGSRGIGNELAKGHIKGARSLMERYFIELEDKDLAYYVEGTEEFQRYISDMLWAQEYAFLNRKVMMDRAYYAFRNYIGRKGWGVCSSVQQINCHHNFTQKENHHGKNLWITRKGAIKAAKGDLGIIPGSMGARSYIVRGLGNPASYNSCSHGAGRQYSRTKAKELFSPEILAARMEGKVWNADRAQYLVDEIPDAYKPIEAVMEAQKDLVEVVHTLTQIFNYKGQ